MRVLGLLCPIWLVRSNVVYRYGPHTARERIVWCNAGDPFWIWLSGCFHICAGAVRSSLEIASADLKYHCARSSVGIQTRMDRFELAWWWLKESSILLTSAQIGAQAMILNLGNGPGVPVDRNHFSRCRSYNDSDSSSLCPSSPCAPYIFSPQSTHNYGDVIYQSCTSCAAAFSQSHCHQPAERSAASSTEP